ncbi:Phosphoenolpyruvate/pyruvate domain-containing protein, partial [Aspergillus karnatakaensis]|uniref:HpcH/HpaI aldolase family protein n=1 Tax=Aspergillus karnatakaensis TaxID=1810916 RepID=UPI003CCE121D
AQPSRQPTRRWIAVIGLDLLSLVLIEVRVQIAMSLPTPITSALQGPSVAFGFWLTLPSGALAKTIVHGSSCSSTKFSWILIDAEHGLISDNHYYDASSRRSLAILTNAIASEDASPIIRIPSAEEWMIKRALDAGAHGIMVPMCHSEVHATNIVKYAKYPPLGTRGYGPMFAPHSFRGVNAGPEYDDGAQVGITIAVQIESQSGVENVERIAAVDGVDVVFVGPFDLARQMGITRGGEEHEAAIQRILKATHAVNKKAAIFCTDGLDALARAKQGFDMISVNTDVGVLRAGMLNELKTANGEAMNSTSKDTY